MGNFLQREGANYYGSRFVTVTDAQITPDLSQCRIYVSVFRDPDPQQLIDSLNAHHGDIRNRFGHIMRRNLRIIPEITFYLDDTLDKVFRIEEILKKDKRDTQDE